MRVNPKHTPLPLPQERLPDTSSKIPVKAMENKADWADELIAQTQTQTTLPPDPLSNLPQKSQMILKQAFLLLEKPDIKPEKAFLAFERALNSHPSLKEDLGLLQQVAFLGLSSSDTQVKNKGKKYLETLLKNPALDENAKQVLQKESQWLIEKPLILEKYKDVENLVSENKSKEALTSLEALKKQHPKAFERIPELYQGLVQLYVAERRPEQADKVILEWIQNKEKVFKEAQQSGVFEQLPELYKEINGLKQFQQNIKHPSAQTEMAQRWGSGFADMYSNWEWSSAGVLKGIVNKPAFEKSAFYKMLAGTYSKGTERKIISAEDIKKNQMKGSDQEIELEELGEKKSKEEIKKSKWNLPLHQYGMGETIWEAKAGFKPFEIKKQLIDKQADFQKRIEEALKKGDLKTVESIKAEEANYNKNWGIDSVNAYASFTPLFIQSRIYGNDPNVQGLPASLKLGTLTSSADSGMEFEAGTKAQAGIDAKGGRYELGGESHYKWTTGANASAFAGVQAHAGVSGGGQAHISDLMSTKLEYATDVKASGEFFAGARASATASGSVFGIGGRVGASAGAGLGAGFEIGGGFKDGTFTWDFQLMPPIPGVVVKPSLGFQVNTREVSAAISGGIEKVQDPALKHAMQSYYDIACSTSKIAMDSLLGVSGAADAGGQGFRNLGTTLNAMVKGTGDLKGTEANAKEMDQVFQEAWKKGNYLEAIGKGTGSFFKMVGEASVHLLAGTVLSKTHGLDQENEGILKKLDEQIKEAKEQGNDSLVLQLEASKQKITQTTQTQKTLAWVPPVLLAGAQTAMAKTKRAEVLESQVQVLQSKIEKTQDLKEKEKLQKEILELQDTIKASKTESTIDAFTFGGATAATKAYAAVKPEIDETLENARKDYEKAKEEVTSGEVGKTLKGVGDYVSTTLRTGVSLIGEGINIAGRTVGNWLKGLFGG